MIATSAPFSQYFDKNGDPLDSGYVYFGVPDANPETSPIPAYWDEAGTQPVAQPARTLAGYIVRNGTPARVYVEGAYSQTVKNKKGELVYYAANSEDYSNLPVNVATIEATAGQTNVNLPFSYTRGNNSLAVYLNGTLLLKDRDYIETSETAIQMLNPLKVGPGGADEVTAIGGRLINPSSAVGTVSAAALAAGSGAGLVGYNPSLTFPADTVGERLQATTFVVDAITAVDVPALGIVDGDMVLARGRSAVGDGGAVPGGYRYVAASVASVNGGTIIAPTVGSGRLIANTDGDAMNAAWFGVRGDGITDDASAFNAAVLTASVIVRAGTVNNDIVTSRVILPPGVIRIASAVTLKTCVQIVGAGSGATCILVDYAGNGLVTTSGQYSNIRLQGFTMEKAGSAVDAISVVGLIRNCVFNDVVVKGFRRSFNIDDTWTLLLENCASYSVTENHLYCGTGCGEIRVSGGRYDVAASDCIYMNSTVGELTVTNAAVQFGSKAAVRADSARTVRLQGNFFEGNCIGSATDYYLMLTGNNDTLSSCVIEDNVFNDLADPNRTGLGIIQVNSFESFVYRERWARNSVSVIPVVGANVQTVDIKINNAGAMTSALTPITGSDDNFAKIEQIARPFQWYGIDMNATGSVAPLVRSTAIFLSDPAGEGVALGTHDGVGTVQSYGGDLKLNPWAGALLLGSQGATIAAGTNEFYGRLRLFSQISSSNVVPAATIAFVAVNCSGGARFVTLTNILATTGGRRLEVVKNDATANTLTITPASGTINGAATFVLTGAYQSVRLTADGTNWIAS